MQQDVLGGCTAVVWWSLDMHVGQGSAAVLSFVSSVADKCSIAHQKRQHRQPRRLPLWRLRQLLYHLLHLACVWPPSHLLLLLMYCLQESIDNFFNVAQAATAAPATWNCRHICCMLHKYCHLLICYCCFMSVCRRALTSSLRRHRQPRQHWRRQPHC